LTAPDETLDRARLVASIAEQLGSRQEAVWLVDHAGAGLAQGLADRRKAGEPLQYVISSWPFRTVELHVDPRVLIPRPETEHVVGVALGELGRMGPGSGVRVCVDLGTGSGAIALSLAAEGGMICPGIEVWATDVSMDALNVAGENRERLGRTDPTAARRVRLAGGSWFDALPSGLVGRTDLLVSNPPYVAESEYPDLDPVVRDWEPRGALVASAGAGGVEGMADIEAIIAGAPRWLRRSGALVVEIAPSLAAPSVAAAREAGFDRVRTEPDLAGRARTLVAGWQ